MAAASGGNLGRAQTLSQEPRRVSVVGDHVGLQERLVEHAKAECPRLVEDSLSALERAAKEPSATIAGRARELVLRLRNASEAAAACRSDRELFAAWTTLSHVVSEAKALEHVAVGRELPPPVQGGALVRMVCDANPTERDSIAATAPVRARAIRRPRRRASRRDRRRTCRAGPRSDSDPPGELEAEPTGRRLAPERCVRPGRAA
jgi:hypothetical protein